MEIFQFLCVLDLVSPQSAFPAIQTAVTTSPIPSTTAYFIPGGCLRSNIYIINVMIIFVQHSIVSIFLNPSQT